MQLLADEQIVQVATHVADVVERVAITDRDTLCGAGPGDVVCKQGDALEEERMRDGVFFCESGKGLIDIKWPRSRDIMRLAVSII